MKPFAKAVGFSLLVVVALSIAVSYARDPLAPQTPFMRAVSPPSGRAGEEFTARGVALDKDKVAEVYLTDGKLDVQTVILKQSETEIRFKLPEKMPLGRYSMMVLMRGVDPKFIEQPAFLTVIE